MEVVDMHNVTGGLEDFAAAINVLILKPNVVNKRLVGSEILDHQITPNSSLQTFPKTVTWMFICGREGVIQYFKLNIIWRCNKTDLWYLLQGNKCANCLEENLITEKLKLLREREPTRKILLCNNSSTIETGNLPNLDLITAGCCTIFRKCIVKERFQLCQQTSEKQTANKSVVNRSEISDPNGASRQQFETILWLPLNCCSKIVALFAGHSTGLPCYGFRFDPSANFINCDKIPEDNGQNGVRKGSVTLLIEKPNSSSQQYNASQLKFDEYVSGWRHWLVSKCLKQVVRWCNDRIGSTGD